MKGLIIIIIIIAIAFVGFFMLKNNNDINTTIEETVEQEITDESNDMNLNKENSVTDTIEDIATVIYNDEGFSPKEIGVKVGQTVQFVNKSSDNMWVASDDHPTHKKLPEFDNKKTVGSGESYEFIFTKAGEWSYHNHIKPNAIGTIIVE